MTQHPLDRQMGLAGVGGAQDGGDARRGHACGTVAHDDWKVAIPGGFLKRRRARLMRPFMAAEQARNESGPNHRHGPIRDLFPTRYCILTTINHKPVPADAGDRPSPPLRRVRNPQAGASRGFPLSQSPARALPA